MDKKLALIVFTLLMFPLILAGMLAGAVVFALQVGYLFADDYLTELAD